nr:MAG: ORF1 [Torque teno midi virus]
MPFWWGRRQRWYTPYWRKRWRKRKSYKKRNRRLRRYRNRRPTRRRRRRRRGKVRRKFKKIPLTQWQPKYITKCNIKGMTLFLLGGQGKQMCCYSDERYTWTPIKAPGGGGFAIDQFTLQWLYTENLDGNNYWSHTNSTKDLCRYTGLKMIFYRHPKCDFLIHYSRKPNLNPDKYFYCKHHPKEIILRKRTKILHRQKIRPNAKQHLTIRVKPPRTMQTNWYVQHDFANRPLVELYTAAIDMSNAYISSVDTNQLITANSLSLQMYKHTNWGQATTDYNPTGNLSHTLQPIYGNKEGPTINIPNNYSDEVSWAKGWFQTAILKATSFKTQSVFPIWKVRYNPKIDTGHGNMIYAKHITQDNPDPPTSDKSTLLQGLPLWQLLFGYTSYLQKIKASENILKDYVIYIKSPYIYPHKTVEPYLLLDQNFIEGKAPFEQELDSEMQKLWFPTIEHQQQILNTIVQCGPYIPKWGRERESSWDLHGHYTFYFKWGGEDIQEQDAYDPTNKTQYAINNNITEAIQISDPSQQIPSSIVHAWDLRQGVITRTALKRIRQNIPTDETISTDSETPTKKKKTSTAVQFQNQETQALQTCLQELFEESTSQESQSQEDLKLLIKQQHQQQKQLKHNLLHLIADLKKQQTKIKMKTGLLL